MKYDLNEGRGSNRGRCTGLGRGKGREGDDFWCRIEWNRVEWNLK